MQVPGIAGLDPAEVAEPRPTSQASAGAELPLAEQLPESRTGRAAIAILDAVQQTAEQHGYFAAGEEAARRLRAARELRSPERRFLGDALADILRGLRRLRTLAGRKRMSGRVLYVTYLVDRTSERNAERNPEQPAGPAGSERGLGSASATAVSGGYPIAVAAPQLAELPRVLMHRATEAGLNAQELVQRAAELATRLAQAETLPESERPTAIGEALSYPDWLVAALITDLGLTAAITILRTQNQRAPLTVRANLLKCTRTELSERLRREGVAADESGLAAHALHLRTRVNAYGLPAFTDGWFELQDEGSQLIAELCAPPPAATILDACAGAGGKTLALGALLGNKGRIVAMDIDRGRLSELQKRARRAGLSCVQSLCASADGQRPPRSDALPGLPPGLVPRGAQRVLCDVPCSGLGVLRRHPEARWHLGPRALAEINQQQRQILAACAHHVQPHGRLIYATCTLLRRENDEIVDDFLRDHPEFIEVPVKEILGSERAHKIGDGNRLRLLPTADGPDGFFAAVLRRQADVPR